MVDANTPLSISLPGHGPGTVGCRRRLCSVGRAHSGHQQRRRRHYPVVECRRSCPSHAARPVYSLPYGGRSLSGVQSGRRTLASNNVDSTIRLWSVADPAHPRRSVPPDRPYRSCRFCGVQSRQATLASSSYDNTIRLWNVADPAHPTPLGGSARWPYTGINSVAFKPGWTHLTAQATMARFGVECRRTRAISRRSTNSPATPRASCRLVFSQMDTVGSGSGDGTIRLWDVTSPTKPRPSPTLDRPYRHRPVGGI